MAMGEERSKGESAKALVNLLPHLRMMLLGVYALFNVGF